MNGVLITIRGFSDKREQTTNCMFTEAAYAGQFFLACLVWQPLQSEL